ncbi:hypothetical protein Vadar_016562 [Vaccinium darrowii]|uniref:Uncharacterized protein n=1 Tax=Vaccinium darrowii TaxID=229202 RepID=A0ACB7YFA7_9ERIC|nr:hypothetical protein Vadar_016562 [Vaccinium darrowii]
MGKVVLPTRPTSNPFADSTRHGQGSNARHINGPVASSGKPLAGPSTLQPFSSSSTQANKFHILSNTFEDSQPSVASLADLEIPISLTHSYPPSLTSAKTSPSDTTTENQFSISEYFIPDIQRNPNPCVGVERQQHGSGLGEYISLLSNTVATGGTPNCGGHVSADPVQSSTGCPNRGDPTKPDCSFVHILDAKLEPCVGHKPCRNSPTQTSLSHYADPSSSAAGNECNDSEVTVLNRPGSNTKNISSSLPHHKVLRSTRKWGYLHKVVLIPEDELVWPVLGQEWIVVDDNSIIDNMPKILMWNCRGASNLHFRRNFAELVHDHKPLMVILTENHIGGSRAETICKSLGFPNFCIVDLVGFAGGIWLLWNEDNISCEVLHTTEQEIHACVQVSPHNFCSFM